MMNNNSESILSGLSYYGDNKLFDLIDSIKYSLKVSNYSSDYFYEDFELICESFPNEVEEIMYCFERIDVLSAIDIINSRIGNNFEFPIYVGFWFNKAISARIKTMRGILENSKSKRLVR